MYTCYGVSRIFFFSSGLLYWHTHRTCMGLWHGWAITFHHNSDVIMASMASQIISLTIVYSTVYSGADQRKHQSSAPLAFVRGMHRWPVNSPHKGPVTRKMFLFDDVIKQKAFDVIIFTNPYINVLMPLHWNRRFSWLMALLKTHLLAKWEGSRVEMNHVNPWS